LLQSAKKLCSTLGINAVDRAFLMNTDGGELCSDVMASNITDDPEYWQKRAEEARTLAEQMMDTHTPSRSCLVSRQATKKSPNGPRNVVTSRVKREIMDLNETIIEVADHRRHLQLIKDAVLDAQDLCARTRSTVQASQELLQQVDDLYRSNMGPVLHKNKYGV
jgi:hypothetical protein